MLNPILENPPEIDIKVNTEQAKDDIDTLSVGIEKTAESTAQAAADLLDTQKTGFKEVTEETFGDITGYAEAQADAQADFWDAVVDSLHGVNHEQEVLRDNIEESSDTLGDMYEDLFDPQEISDNITEIVSGAEDPLEELNNRLSDSLNMEDALNNIKENMQEVNAVTEEGTVIENQRQAATNNLISAEQGANLVLAQRVMAEQGLSLEEQQLLLSESQRLASESAILTAEGQRISTDATLTEAERQQKLEELQLAMSKQALTAESMKATIALIDQKLATGELVTAEELAIQTTYKNILALKQQETQSKLTAAAISLVKGALNLLATTAIMFVFTLIAKKVDEVIHKAERLAEEAQKARESIESLKKTMADSAKTANSLKKRYAELAQGVDKLGTAFQNQGSLSTEDYEEFLDISNQLADLYPQLTKGYTDNGDALLKLSGDANTITKALDDIIERTNQITRMRINEEMTKVWDDDINNIKKYEEELSNISSYAVSYGVMEERGSGYEEYLKAYEHLLDLINHSATKNLSLTEDLTRQEQELIAAAANDLGVDFRAGTDAKGLIDPMTVFNFGKYGPEVSQQFREYFSNMIKEYQGYFYQTEDKIAQINARMENNLVDYLTGDITYLGLDKNRQQIINSILNDFDISSIPKEANVESWDDLTRWYQTNIIHAIAKIDNKEIQQKMADLFSGEGTLAEAQDLYETVYNYLITMFTPDDPIIVYLKAQLEEQQATVDNALTKLLGNVSDKDLRQQYAIGLRSLLEGASDEFINWILNDLTIPPDVIYSEQQLLDMWEKLQNAGNQLSDTDPFADISESIRDVNKQLDPFFNSLADLYTVLFEDGVFDFDKIDISKLAALEEQFNNIADELKADLGDSFDASIVEKFFSDIKNASDTKEAQKAVNEFATAWFYNTEVLKDLNPETAKYIKRMMELTGITNADEIVTKALADAESKLIIEEEIANGASVERIQKLLDERNASEALRISILQSVLATEGFNDTDVSVSDKINKLKELAGAYLDTANAARVAGYASTLEAGMKYGGLSSAKADELIQQYVASLSDLEPAEVKWQKYNDSASKAGKEDADAYLEAYEKELENLNWLHENGYINEKEWLDQRRLLTERYFKDNEKYAQQYFEALHEYLTDLESLYQDAIGAAISLIDDEIDEQEKLRDAEKKEFEESKKENEKKVKAIEKLNKNLDKEIKKLEKEQKLIQKNNIDPLQEQIKAREEVKKNLEEELSIMQKQNEARQDAINIAKAEYELQRSLHQRTTLVYTDDDGLGGQMRYRADSGAVRNAQENLDNLQYEMRIKSKQEEIDLIETEIDDLNDQVQSYQDQIDAISKKIELLNEEKDANSEIIEDLNAQNDLLDEQIDAIDEKYDKIIEDANKYKEEWQKIADLTDKAKNNAILISLGFDPEAIKKMDPKTLEALGTNYNAVLGALYSNDQGMTEVLQKLTGSSLGDYLSATANGIAELNRLDLSSVSAAIQSAGQGALAMNDGFALSDSILSGVVQNLDNVAKSAENAVSVIGTAISTERSGGTDANGNPTLASSIAIVGGTSEEAFSEEDGVQHDLAGVTEAAGIATESIGEIRKALDDLTDSSPYEIEIRVNKIGDEISAHASGTVGNAYANGYPGLAHSELALRSEYGQPELAVYPNGSYELTNSPTLSQLPKDTVIFNEEQTKRILKNSGVSGKTYASGNASLKTLAEVMPEKAAIFDRLEANLPANIEAIKTNTFDISRNVADMAKAVTNNMNYGGNTITNTINVTCPGVTEAEIAKNLGSALSNELSSLFQGAALKADQWAMRR